MIWQTQQYSEHILYKQRKREKYINETENIYVPFFEQHSPEIAKRIKEILKYLKTNEQPTEKELQQIKQVHDSYILINKITE